VYYSRLAHYGGIPDLARAKQADGDLRRAHEFGSKRGRFVGFAPVFGSRKLAAEAAEARSAACTGARRRILLFRDGRLGDPEQTLLVAHLQDCMACSSL
jgi:hypothetical protein